MNEKDVAVIGAGVGGLATAARLASKGCKVKVYEKLSEAGGRAHMIEDQGFRFDTGPSFVLMPDFFSEVFSYCGQNLEDYLDLKVLDISYKIFYPDNTTLTVYRDSEKTKQELEKFESGSSLGFDKFIAAAKVFYDIARPMLYQSYRKSAVLKPRYWGVVSKLKINQTYWDFAKQFFKSDKLCYAFTFEAMFIGVSPFDAPALYSVIAYTDHVQKIAHPIGGMYQIPRALEAMAKKFGAQIDYNCEIKEIKKSKGSFILKSQNGDHQASKVVANADYAYTQKNLLGRSLPNFKYSCSVYLMYLGLKEKAESLEHHNLFFSRDLKKNLQQIFNDKVIPEDPSFYIHVPTRTDPSLAPQGKDIAYILIPVPNLENFKGNFLDYEESLRDNVFGRVKKMIGVDLRALTEVEHRFYPEDFIKRYNIENGATFGLAHTLMQSAFFRPYNADSKLNGLYFVGASTQPGGGLPPVIASSKIVSDLILS